MEIIKKQQSEYAGSSEKAKFRVNWFPTSIGNKKTGSII